MIGTAPTLPDDPRTPLPALAGQDRLGQRHLADHPEALLGRSQTPLGRDVGRGVSGRVDGAVFVVSVLSMVGLIIGNGMGLAVAVIYWAAWGIYGLCNPRLMLMPAHYLLPWLFPLWSLITSVWSIDPVSTIRVSLEMMVTTQVALMMARALTPRGILLSLWAALAIAVVAGIAFSKDEVIYATNVTAMNGFFGSKNSFAMFGGLLLIVSTAILLDGGEQRAIRFGGLVLSAVGAGALVAAHSSDANFASVVATGLVIASSLFARLKPEYRLAWALVGVLCALMIGVAVLSDWDSTINQGLAVAGKNSTLTGRAYLWSRAQDIIAAHPFIGVGNQAFWRQGNLDAEGMWGYLKITERAGVTMHNLYYEATLNTGWVGFAILVATIALSGVASLGSYLARANGWATASLAMVGFFAMRAFLETEFLTPFIIGSVLIPLIYASARCNIADWRAELGESGLAEDKP